MNQLLITLNIKKHPLINIYQHLSNIFVLINYLHVDRRIHWSPRNILLQVLSSIKMPTGKSTTSAKYHQLIRLHDCTVPFLSIHVYDNIFSSDSGRFQLPIYPIKCCHDWNFNVTGGTISCRYDKLRCQSGHCAFFRISVFITFDATFDGVKDGMIITIGFKRMG